MRTASVILSFLVAFAHIPFSHADSFPETTTLDELKAMFPSARFVQVSKAEYDLLLASGGNQAEILVEPPPEADEPPAVKEHRPPPERGTIVPARARIPTGTQPVTHVDVVAFGHGTGSVATDDLAIILYVLVGAVVIAAAVLYGGFIIYEMIAGRAFYEYWGEIACGAWHFGGSGRRGGMYGGRATWGLIGDYNRVGLTLESGYLDGRFRFRDDDGFLSVTGAYGLLGPSVYWLLTDNANPLSIDFEILTGYSTANNVGLMSRAMAGFSWGWGPTWRMGLMAGSTYAKIRESEGPLNTKSDFNLTAGGWLGAQF